MHLCSMHAPWLTMFHNTMSMRHDCTQPISKNWTCFSIVMLMNSWIQYMPCSSPSFSFKKWAMNATGRVHGSLVPNFQKVTNAPPRAQCSSPAFLYMYTCTRLQTIELHVYAADPSDQWSERNVHGKGEFAWPGWICMARVNLHGQVCNMGRNI